MFEAIFSDTDNNVLAAVTAHQHCAWNRQPWILGRLDTCFGCAGAIQFLFEEILRCADAEIGVVRDLQCAAAGSFRQAAPGVRLQPPSDTPEKELLMFFPRFSWC